jgi:SPX domain protein involved in polyphosphate accumulation
MLYSDFIKSKIVSHNDNIDTYYDGIKHLIESKADIVSYNTQKNLLFNVAVLEVDKNGDYIYEYSLERQADIIDNIHIVSSNNNVKMKFIIGEEEYDHINTFLSVVAQYQEFKIKLLFTEPKIDDKISICYRNYLLNSDLRKKITTRGNIIKTDTNIYTDGMCGRI